MHLHVGSEAARLDASVLYTGAIDKVFEQPPALSRFGRRRKAGPHTPPCVRRQGELWNQQQATADIGHTEIHASLAVSENAISQHTLQHPVGMAIGVKPLHAEKNQQPLADSRDGFAPGNDVCAENPLEKRNHWNPGFDPPAAVPASPEWANGVLD
jgi:hypothetical protein